VHVIATPSRQLGYPVLQPHELQSTIRLHAPLCAVSYTFCGRNARTGRSTTSQNQTTLVLHCRFSCSSLFCFPS